MIYRVHLNGRSPMADGQRSPHGIREKDRESDCRQSDCEVEDSGDDLMAPAPGEGAESRWFAAQVASRYARHFNQDLPVGWSDLVQRLRESET